MDKGNISRQREKVTYVFQKWLYINFCFPGILSQRKRQPCLWWIFQDFFVISNRIWER